MRPVGTKTALQQLLEEELRDRGLRREGARRRPPSAPMTAYNRPLPTQLYMSAYIKGVYIYIHAYIHTNMYFHVYIYIYIYVNMSTYVYVCIVNNSNNSNEHYTHVIVPFGPPSRKLGVGCVPYRLVLHGSCPVRGKPGGWPLPMR